MNIIGDVWTSDPYNSSRMPVVAFLHGLYSLDKETLITIEIEIIFE